MIVTVTAADIKHGRRKSQTSCPIALAIKKKSNVTYVKTGCSTSTVRRGWDSEVYYKYPKSVFNFVKKFDRGEKVRPFTFRARVFDGW